MKALEKLDVANAASAIEKDAGRALPRLRTSLKQAKVGDVVVVRQQGRPVGSTEAGTTRGAAARP